MGGIVRERDSPGWLAQEQGSLDECGELGLKSGRPACPAGKSRLTGETMSGGPAHGSGDPRLLAGSLVSAEGPAWYTCAGGSARAWPRVCLLPEAALAPAVRATLSV